MQASKSCVKRSVDWSGRFAQWTNCAIKSSRLKPKSRLHEKREKHGWVVIFTYALVSYIYPITRASSHHPEPDFLSASTSGAPPVALTQQIATIRLEHAALLESHGSTAALLRSREAELAAARGQSEKFCKTVASLEEHIRLLDQKIRRRETRLSTAEREIGFLQALVVRLILGCLPLALKRVALGLLHCGSYSCDCNKQ